MTNRPALVRGKTGCTGHGAAALACLALLSAAPFVHAQDLLHWKDAWMRSMPPGAQVTAAYGQLMNHGDQPVTLLLAWLFGSYSQPIAVMLAIATGVAPIPRPQKPPAITAAS